MTGRLLTRGESSPKISHGDLDKYEAAILHLLPHTEGGFKTSVCPWSTVGCRATCLNYAGRGQMVSVQDGRWWKSDWFRRDRTAFMDQLLEELTRLAKRARAKGKRAVARLDGTSDLGLAGHFAGQFPTVMFYDYTKSYIRYSTWLFGPHPPGRYQSNRHLTFSRSEVNQKDSSFILQKGGTVAVVFNTRRGEALPKTWGMGLGEYPVVDGDQHDFRFLDPPGHIIGLRAKGLAKRDQTGFVVHVD